ncbi:hypothetical protein K7X08_033216 [Anisodus acutangulus]|uniref:Uncharacterized protein n=1 Tax=Anisodus acutangulus TaxID=402998 RepID=A0A9Q1RBS7_9SOLA|nr:hypothetical protein K7X08_033216 [Anisodus acutangulus]
MTRVEKNNQQQDQVACEDILENVWANFISKNDQAHENSQRVANECSEKYWEQLPILERLPSLGRWISMGAETWEEILDGIIALPNDEKHSSDASTSKDEDVVNVEKKKKMLLHNHRRMKATEVTIELLNTNGG